MSAFQKTLFRLTSPVINTSCTPAFLIYCHTFSSDAMRHQDQHQSTVRRISEKYQLHCSDNQSSWQWKTNPEKVLVLFYPWFGAKPKHQDKYRQLYLASGLDVLTVESFFKDFAWPANAKKFAHQTLEVLDQHCAKYDHFLFHAMSIGAFNFTVFRMIAAAERDKYNVLQRCRGLVYDSMTVGSGHQGGLVEEEIDSKDEKPVDATDRILHGLVSTETENKLAQATLVTLGRLYFSLTKKHTIEYSDLVQYFFRENPLPVPHLILASKNDPMSDADVVEQLATLWRTINHIPVQLKQWEVSVHAKHLVHHQEEYMQELNVLLESVFDKDLPVLSRAARL